MGVPGAAKVLGSIELIQMKENSTVPWAPCCHSHGAAFPPRSITVLQSMKLGIDVNRHKEIIVKSISALLLLLLKHFKLNHIYQVGLEEGMAIAQLGLKVLIKSLLEDFWEEFP